MSETSRRKFARSIAAAGVALPLASALPAANPLPRALGDLTRAQYGRHLDADDLTRIEKDFEESTEPLERFRSFKLTNADAPDFL